MPPELMFSLCHLVVIFSPPDTEGADTGLGGEAEVGEEKGLGDRLLWLLHNTNILAWAKIAPVEVAIKVSLSLIPFHCGVQVWSEVVWIDVK